ncbi:MAG: methylated-DNA--[protein]-cysteine S-methyltransferase [Bryobacterales bacterium]|nr:methylated-DNA--[protein]-cysteine S-methyltransferase [Bryobacterales bacterium]
MTASQLPPVLIRACEALDARSASVAEAAAFAGTTERKLRQAFREHLGVSPRQFQQSARLNRAKVELRTAPNTLDALFAAGYGSVRGLYEAGPGRLGMTPATFARQGNGLTLFIETASHALGLVLVAGTERGVSFVGIGESLDSLEAELHRDYPRAAVKPAVAPRWITGVLNALDAPAIASEIPLDVYATAFQARVWEALCQIPIGETRTYTGLAAELGKPSASRAVARACATNSAAILIPCHRVIGASGSLTGYRWGLARKEALLRTERLAAVTCEAR